MTAMALLVAARATRRTTRRCCSIPAAVSGTLGLYAYYRGMAIGAIASCADRRRLRDRAGRLRVPHRRPARPVQYAGMARARSGSCSPPEEHQAGGRRQVAAGVGLALFAALGFGFSSRRCTLPAPPTRSGRRWSSASPPRHSCSPSSRRAAGPRAGGRRLSPTGWKVVVVASGRPRALSRSATSSSRPPPAWGGLASLTGSGRSRRPIRSRRCSRLGRPCMSVIARDPQVSFGVALNARGRHPDRRLDVEANVQDVAVGDDVGLALEALQAPAGDLRV